MIVAAAVIAPNNSPLYLSTFGGEDDSARLSTLVHCSLDVVEEKVAAGLRGTAPGDGPDAYLGLLSAEDELKVFGFVTNTRVKLVAVVDDPVVKDDEMRAIFRRMHAAFVDAVSNPFYQQGAPLVSPRFDASIRTIATSLGAS
ncbi:Trafficking particle complex subunit 2 [Chlorella sorokiniana]|uniref:Trafficking protein particle complex subunit 2-like protein n=1 Tax=Chlorella sorokiniana TaxID=3076 RepID=A0A2P6TJE1_CHLSO|nr:Trafficking particle complex subunit 2 [Chlorella sorokiniana]|eukprot:PRW39361.1 Trafficking particle complex subunit 2 [Chlorella sorokiniana]